MDLTSSAKLSYLAAGCSLIFTITDMTVVLIFSSKSKISNYSSKLPNDVKLMSVAPFCFSETLTESQSVSHKEQIDRSDYFNATTVT